MENANVAHAVLAVSPTGPDEFTSNHPPRTIGNPPPIGYGGCTVGVAVLSAYGTVPNPNFHIYSVLGAFHGFTRNDRRLICRVTRTRDTRTFATRRVQVCQKEGDGQDKICAEILIDFHILEDAMTQYSALPSRSYGEGPEDRNATATGPEVGTRMVQNGHILQSVLDFYLKSFEFMEEFFETRYCLDGVSTQTLHGLANHLETSQDGLPITEKTSAEWQRLRQPVQNEAENAAALAFQMDAGMTSPPLNHDHRSIFDKDIAACSTLDFALRFMVPSIQMHKWHLRERKTVAAAIGRTYSESRLWDEEGNLVAIETQSCILRPKKPKANM